MNKFRLIVPMILLFLISGNLPAQTNDAGLWLSLGLEKKFHKYVVVELSEELRLNENFTELGTAFTELGLSTGWHKDFNAGVGYRFIQKRQLDDHYELRHRYHAELSYRYELSKRWTISLRERFQNQYKDVNRLAEGNTKEYCLRSKLTLKYEPNKRVDLTAASEVYYQLNNPDGNEIDNLRFSLSAGRKLTKKQSIDVFYLIDREIHVADPLTSYVLGLGYKYSL